MKKIILLIILFLPFAGFTQTFNGGILAGGLVSQIDGDTWVGYHKFGYLAGGFVSLRLSPHSSFQLEMEYIQKGSKHIPDPENSSDQLYLFRLHYLEIPLLYQFSFGNRFAVETGPAMDVLLGYLEEQDGIENPPTEPVRPVTLSGILGASVYITGHLKANFRFNYSLISLRNSSAPYPASYRKILFEYGQYNNLLSLSLSWNFKPRDN
ncbi:MAG: porin family protein [Bacteroidota bacterium]